MGILRQNSTLWATVRKALESSFLSIFRKYYKMLSDAPSLALGTALMVCHSFKPGEVVPPALLWLLGPIISVKSDFRYRGHG